ncbi:MAG: hypothetical protein Q4B54_04310 [Coriobacteriales bacterium]|nr:hypothetical protein [Coriobacteriales bacterium]
MNVIFVSPHFPETYWQFCDRLKQNGATVLGIGDSPYEYLGEHLHDVLDEYYYVPSMENYDDMFRAVAYYSWRYGKIDWLESNNEYWLSQDARLRTDFNISTGANSEQMALWQSKASMKPLYAAGGVPTARQIRASSLDEARAFANEVAFPLFAKPERGVGSDGGRKIGNDHELEDFFYHMPPVPYVLEEFVTGDICAYDAILNAQGDPIFENQDEFPPSMSELVERQLDLSYYCTPSLDPKLQALGRAAAKGFGLKSRFVHMEFFRLTQDKPGLGRAGDYVGLEVNVRPPGGYSPDMMNFAHATDVYRIWADMVCYNSTLFPQYLENYYCVYAGRRDCHRYLHSHEEVLNRYNTRLMMQWRMPDALSDDMGNHMYVARLGTDEERKEFVSFVQQQRED